MEIKKTAKAGSSEIGDILVTVSPSVKTSIEIELQSKKVVLKQFGRQIEKVIRDITLSMGVKNALIKAADKGALDYTIRARVETAIRRAI